MHRHWFTATLIAALTATTLAQPPATAPATQPADTPAVLLERALFQETTAGNLDAAGKIYRQIIDEGAANRPYIAQALYHLGVIQLKQKHPAEAIDLFARLKSDYPEQKDLLEKAAAQIAQARGKLDEKQVAEIVDAAVSKIATMAETDPRLNTTLATLEGLDENAVVKELIAELASPTAEVRRSAIYILYKGPMKNIDPAVPALEKLLTHPEPFTRGMAALALGTRNIQKEFDNIAKLATTDKSGYARRCAVAALAEFGTPEAKAVVQKAASDDKDEMVQAVAKQMLERWPTSTTSPPPTAQVDAQVKISAATAYAKGQRLRDEDKLPEAEEAFLQAVTLDPSMSNAWSGLGWVQIHLGKSKKARASLAKAVELDPKNAAALDLLGWFAQTDGRTDDAKKFWNQAIAADPHATSSMIRLARLAEETGDYNQAINWYNQWLKAEPANPDAKTALAKAKTTQAAVAEAQPAAETWLKLLDDANYADTYKTAAAPFTKALTADAWKTVATQVRAPLGKPSARKLKSAQYATSLPGAPDGQYVILQFNTTFENKKDAIETVTPMKDKDGKWKVSGYFVK